MNCLAFSTSFSASLYTHGKIYEYLTFTVLKQKANKIHENL